MLQYTKRGDDIMRFIITGDAHGNDVAFNEVIKNTIIFLINGSKKAGISQNH